MKIAIIGAGAMGAGIAQVAAQNGHHVYLTDKFENALAKAKTGHEKILARLVEKGKLAEGEDKEIVNRISYTSNMADLADAGLVIEAVVENIEVKKAIFGELEGIVSEDAILASNTSSLSIASIGSSVKKRIV